MTNILTIAEGIQVAIDHARRESANWKQRGREERQRLQERFRLPKDCPEFDEQPNVREGFARKVGCADDTLRVHRDNEYEGNPHIGKSIVQVSYEIIEPSLPWSKKADALISRLKKVINAAEWQGLEEGYDHLYDQTYQNLSDRLQEQPPQALSRGEWGDLLFLYFYRQGMTMKIETETSEAREKLRGREKRGELSSRRAIELITFLYENNAKKYAQHEDQYLIITDCLLSVLSPKAEDHLWATILSLKVHLNRLTLQWNLIPPQERSKQEYEFDLVSTLRKYLEYSCRPRYRDTYALRNSRSAIENAIAYESVMRRDQHFGWLRQKLIEAYDGEEPDYWNEKRFCEDSDFEYYIRWLESKNRVEKKK